MYDDEARGTGRSATLDETDDVVRSRPGPKGQPLEMPDFAGGRWGPLGLPKSPLGMGRNALPNEDMCPSKTLRSRERTETSARRVKHECDDGIERATSARSWLLRSAVTTT